MPCTINLSLNTFTKTCVYFFFPFLNSLGNTHVTVRGGTSTQPHPRVRVRTQGNTVDPPKTQVSLVRMRPREFLAYHKDET